MSKFPETVEKFLAHPVPEDFLDLPVQSLLEPLREIYRQTKIDSDNFAFDPEGFKGQKEAHWDFAIDLSIEIEYIRMAQSWLLMNLNEKIRNTENLVLKYLEYRDIHDVNVRIELASNGKSISFYSDPENEDEPAFYYSHILNKNNASLIDTFEGAVSAAIYTGARIFQQSLIKGAHEIAPGTNKHIGAHLFRLAQNMVPVECENGLFYLEPDEFGDWMDQANYRHALHCVSEVITVWKKHSEYELPSGFLKGWQSTFTAKMVDAAFSQFEWWDQEDFSSPVLERIEQILNQVPDSLILEEKTQSELYAFFDYLKEEHGVNFSVLDNLRRRVLFGGNRQSVSINAAKADIYFVDRVADWDLTSKFNDVGARSDVLYKLFKVSGAYPNQQEIARKLAFEIELNARDYELIEDHENELLARLYDRMQDDLKFSKIRELWPVLDEKSKLSHLRKVAKLQAEIFEFQRAKHIGIFSMSLEQYRAKIAQGDPLAVYPSAYARNTKGGMINFNVHPDADALGDYNRSIEFMLHEQNHNQQFQTVGKMENYELSDRDPYGAIAKALGLSDGNPWHKDASMRRQFYRVSLVERHSYAINGKYRALVNGQDIPSERDILTQSLSKQFL